MALSTGNQAILPARELAANVAAAVAAAGGGVVSADSAPEPLSEWEAVNHGAISERDILMIYANMTGIGTADDDLVKDTIRVENVSRDFLHGNGCLPMALAEAVPANADGDDLEKGFSSATGLEMTGEPVTLAVYHPYHIGRLTHQWRAMFGVVPEFVLARRSLIEHTLDSLYSTGDEDAADLDLSSEKTLKDLAREAPIVRLVNTIFGRAVECGASDIHIEPSDRKFNVRYRVDGVLNTAMSPPASQYPAVASRIKLLAGMNIAERRKPQDGRMDLPVGGGRIDVRASTVPSVHGESIVLRLLEKETSQFDLESIGIDETTRAQFGTMARMPYGMILVVGPTGSGKTTTLYSVMQVLNSDSVKIITIEDPVEYQIDGLTQIQVNPKIDVTFANGLRSIVRQDPDIILVGEIRDRETAEIAIHAALTGHLVFSTLHTNDAVGAVARLQEMGIEGFLISSALLGVMSQRLVRRVCSSCGGDTALRHKCPLCNGAGYRGRTGIFELLVIDDALRRGINEKRDSGELAAIARQRGMRTLFEDGMAKVAAGETTRAEVARVCQLDSE
ncbi:MAG: ATPase, T2SS/T4P/T4SS family [Lentisphaeria bacterium]|nr:ATPase, T2SS/T4P/T4SS family [Lentisphaeria bacterium]